MKYIRTKDEIYKCKTIEQYRYLQTKHEIIKTADTIKELCDELIIKNPNNDGDFFRKVFVYENRWENILNEKHAQFCTTHYKQKVEIFGAIWVIDSNGVPTLKPVAKMND